MPICVKRKEKREQSKQPSVQYVGKILKQEKGNSRKQNPSYPVRRGQDRINRPSGVGSRSRTAGPAVFGYNPGVVLKNGKNMSR
jgi:hypothetical protein